MTKEELEPIVERFELFADAHDPDSWPSWTDVDHTVQTALTENAGEPWVAAMRKRYDKAVRLLREPLPVTLPPVSEHDEALPE